MSNHLFSNNLIFVVSKGGLLGLCIGASLMSFVELIDLALNCFFIFCVSKAKRVDVNGEEFVEKSESDLRLDRLEGQLKGWINMVTVHEAQLAAMKEQVRLSRAKD